MMEKPESPIKEEEAAHLGRAAEAMGFKSLDEYIANLYQRLFKFAEQANAYHNEYDLENQVKKLKKEKSKKE